MQKRSPPVKAAFLSFWQIRRARIRHLTIFASHGENSVPLKGSVLHVLAIFRRYQVGVGQMLFINSPPGQLRSGLANLINAGLVQRERPKDAYSLTEQGFAAVRSLPAGKLLVKRLPTAAVHG